MTGFLWELGSKFGVGNFPHKAMLLAPRHTYKTTIGVVALPLLLITKYPNIRILIASYAHQTAKERLSEIKWHLEKNHKFIENYGDLRSGSNIWNENAIEINRRTYPHKEPTIDTSGIDRSKTGGHYDLIIADDLVNDRNYDSDIQRAKAKTYLQTLYPLLNPEGGVLLVIGTRWHNQDLYRWILDQAALDRKVNPDGPPEWLTLVRGAFLPSGQLYFPDKLNDMVLARLRRSLQPKLFTAWYLNESIEEGTEIFPSANLQYFKGDFFIDRGMPILEFEDGTRVPVYVTMALDPAFAGGPRSDYNGITVLGQDPDGNWYVLVADAYRGTPDQVLKRLVYYARLYHPQTISLEVVSAQVLYKPLILDAMSDAGLDDIGITEYTESNRRKKAARIEAMQPDFLAGKIWVREGQEELIRQFKEYPELEHEDLLDSLSQHREVTRPAEPDETLPSYLSEEEFDEFEDEEEPTRLNGTWTGR